MLIIELLLRLVGLWSDTPTITHWAVILSQYRPTVRVWDVQWHHHWKCQQQVPCTAVLVVHMLHATQFVVKWMEAAIRRNCMYLPRAQIAATQL